MATQVKTKKTAPKKAVKKVASKAASKVPARRVSATDLFSSNPQENTPVEVPRGTVHLVINGQSKGTVESGNLTLGEFVTRHAQSAGLRSFTVYVNSNKIDTRSVGMPLTDKIDGELIAKVELIAKDARGVNNKYTFVVAC